MLLLHVFYECLQGSVSESGAHVGLPEAQDGQPRDATGQRSDAQRRVATRSDVWRRAPWQLEVPEFSGTSAGKAETCCMDLRKQQGMKTQEPRLRPPAQLVLDCCLAKFWAGRNKT